MSSSTFSPSVSSPTEFLTSASLATDSDVSAVARATAVAGWDVLPCRAGDADLWFAERPEDVEAAKALCRDCPVRQRCLEGALERHEPWGVWGGELFVRGAVVARKRPRGRPRKADRVSDAA
jgi:WhiB family redox-sensing transcriptional regulator